MKSLLIGLALIATPTLVQKEQAIIEGCVKTTVQMVKEFDIKNLPNCKKVASDLMTNIPSEEAKQETNLNRFRFTGCYTALLGNIINNELMSEFKNFKAISERYCSIYKEKETTTEMSDGEGE